MKTAGIAIDTWKRPIFERHLTAAGFAYTVDPGPAPGTLLLRVQTKMIADLQPTVEAANAEAREEARK